MRVTIIGGGSMGYAFAALFLKRELIAAGDLEIIEALPERRAFLTGQLPCRIAAEYQAGKREVIIFAVKPQDMHPPCVALRGTLAHDTVVLSIMAGVLIDTLHAALQGHEKLVRAMPNTPFQIGRGITGYYPAAAVTPGECECIERLLKAGGECLRLSREEQLDAVTAVSGSGPAYVYYFIEGLLEAACDLGFAEDQARLLVHQTCEGALALWPQSGLTPRELRQKVTSKGGTTEAAVRVFDDARVRQALCEGVKKAYGRARELAAK